MGAFGIHNFYANRWRRGLIQLLLTVGTGLVGAAISSLWSVVNIFTIKTDRDGRSFDLNLPAKYICGFLMRNPLPMSWYHQKIENRTLQETTEKIVHQTETIYKTTTTVE